MTRQRLTVLLQMFNQTVVDKLVRLKGTLD
jgi:hypothetical protein